MSPLVPALSEVPESGERWGEGTGKGLQALNKAMIAPIIIIIIIIYELKGRSGRWRPKDESKI